MRKRFITVLLAAAMLAVSIGGASAQPTNPRACVGATDSAAAREDGRQFGQQTGEIAQAAGASFGNFVSNFATTCP